MSDQLPQDPESGRRLPKGGPHPRFPTRAEGLDALATWLGRYAVLQDTLDFIEGGSNVRIREYSLGAFTPTEWVVTWRNGAVSAVQHPDWWR